MPKIKVDHSTNQSVTDATAKIREFFETDQDLKKIDPQIKFDFDNKSKTATIAGSQFKAKVSIQEQADKTLVQVEIDLPLLLTPFRGKVEETLQKKLKKYLA